MRTSFPTPPPRRPVSGRGAGRVCGRVGSGRVSCGTKPHSPGVRRMWRRPRRGRCGLSPHLDRKTHDIGFVFASSAVLGWEIGHVAACRDLALTAADRLAGMYHPTAGVIPVGSQAEIAAGLDDVTIDCMVNLPLLWWAWKITGEERFVQDRDLPTPTGRRSGTSKRTAGSFSRCISIRRTGEKTREETHQGSGTDGCWTRGQAWGVYGFAAAYQATTEERFREVADRAATYYFHRAGSDLVPFYCFDDPAIPDVPRDSSAAAITCAGLWILAECVRDPALRRRCRAQRGGDCSRRS